jgi:membrane-bound serine protease (ClpP class)
LLGFSDHIPMLLAGVGMLLFLIEVWFLPGTIVPAAIGVLCILGALTMSLQGFAFPDLSNPVQMQASLNSFGIVIACLAGAFLTSILFVRFVLIRLPQREGMHLKSSLELGGAHNIVGDLTGCEGITVGAMRPRGRIDVGEVSVGGNCVSGFLEAGTPVRLLKRNGNSWDVDPL